MSLKVGDKVLVLSSGNRPLGAKLGDIGTITRVMFPVVEVDGPDHWERKNLRFLYTSVALYTEPEPSATPTTDAEHAATLSDADQRDCFADAALTGLLAYPRYIATPEEVAKTSYLLADAMMKARAAK